MHVPVVVSEPLVPFRARVMLIFRVFGRLLVVPAARVRFFAVGRSF